MARANINTHHGYVIPRNRDPETGYRYSPCDTCDAEGTEECKDCPYFN